MGRLVGIFKRGTVYLKNNGFKDTLKRVDLYIKSKSPRKYKLWIKNCETVTKGVFLSGKPLISVCMPVYNPDEKWLKKAVYSVIRQTYENWELCIADDCSTDEKVREALEELCRLDKRIKVVYREKNGGISAATNTALKASKGEYAALLDNDDELAENALYEAAVIINRNPLAELIYSDEDKIDEKGRRFEPFFKPDYCPDTLLSLNYISHLGIYKRDTLLKLGCFRSELDGSQDYDMALRFSDITDEIYHIPKILYHWRVLNTSTAGFSGNKSYAYTAAKKALELTVGRRGYKAVVKEVKNSDFFETVFLPEDYFASVIIPVKDKAEITEKCLRSIYDKTDINRFEIIIIDNGSTEERTEKLFEKFKKYDNFRVLRLDMPFNFSRLNNIAAKTARGDMLVFLNNDTEVISEDWLDRMAGEAMRSEIGCVGAKLLYPDNTIQHCGIILGGGGLAGSGGIKAPREDKGYFGRYILPYNYSAVTAACMAIKRSLFEKVGGFDEKLAVAFNDVDLCLRVWDTGVKNIVLPSVELYHYESLSRGAEDAPKKKARFKAEIIYMKNKWGEERLLNDPCYNINLDFDSSHMFTPITEKYARRLADPKI